MRWAETPTELISHTCSKQLRTSEDKIHTEIKITVARSVHAKHNTVMLS